MKLRTLLLLLLIASALLAQERKVDATWLHRYVPLPSVQDGHPASGTCRCNPIFGQGDIENRILRSMTRFGEFTLDAHGDCQSALHDREEEIYFVLEGRGVLHYGDQTFPMDRNDFTYLPPGMKHSIASGSEQALRVLVMGFKIPSSSSIGAPSLHPKMVNLDDVKEVTVEGHPTSVLYNLLLGRARGSGTRLTRRT
jgi:mannose-6-phosphate isomerase-like protein (cupin superfamily)